ncbi:uncharacterized protein F4812DRAFT_440947 [Daldinia caldariorum]|uniref:uncharacterized protein n=1 Tax=Daldinia caldariorum TaxID=326644 RepID=UPI0020079BD1|nr:uncharacterized protein F4812DRAFT_440947 [Daldinia caldariorum]KAI1464914.1 hypothetical protein F4812DRAFT_440947 [Daldinia caldariorum]
MHRLATRNSRIFPPSRSFVLTQRSTSSQSHSQTQEKSQHTTSIGQKDATSPKSQGNKKTMAELDAELQQKMSGLSGDGGEAGIEYEDGKPVAMKRGVKNNMFRYI